MFMMMTMMMMMQNYFSPNWPTVYQNSQVATDAFDYNE